MTSSIKSFLPVALATSPLLLAAATPTTPAEMQLSCGLGRAIYREVIAPVQSANSQGHIVHPVASSPQALVTSAHEWTAIWRGAVQDLQAETAPPSLAFVEEAVSAAPTQAQSRCNRKESPTETPTTLSGATSGDIPNLDPSVLSPASPAPVPPAAMPLPDFSTPELSTERPPAETLPGSPELAVPTASPTFSIPTRPISPPPADPGIDPTNVTPTSDPATPFDGVVVPALEALPDGVYRYLSGNYEYGIYSNEQLIANGGAVFLLTKTGDRVVGNFYPTLGQSGVCVDGVLRSNSVLGPAYVMNPIPLDTVASETDAQGTPTAAAASYQPYEGRPSFQVRQPQVLGSRLFYAESLLDLSEYSRINAGTALAPTACDVPSSTLETAVDAEAAD